MEQVLGYCDAGVLEGATRECGGCRHGETGYYVTPTVFSNVTDDMKIAREEVSFFGHNFYVLNNLFENSNTFKVYFFFKAKYYTF